jgi:murein DD-endopeptidase MepM/ murein hydrolase activator NlpD
MGSHKITGTIRKTHTRTALLVTSVFLLVCIPFAAHADVFSFFSGLFSAPTVSASVNMPNSQNMTLLEAPHSPVQPGPSNNQLAILDNTSLSPETEPISPNASTTNANNDQISLYVVHPGDTLPAIAQMFGVSVNTIVWANDIQGNKVSVGDKLVILPISGVQYTVKSGDTLLSIAKKYKGDAGEIAQFNNLSVDAKLAVGQVVIIPDGEVSASESGPIQTTGGHTGSSGSSGPLVYVAPGGTSPLASGALPPPPGSPAVGTRGSQYPTIIGYYERPILGGVKTQGIHGHNAVDLASAYGTPIMAAADGEVIVSKDSGWNGGYGSYIVIKHNNGTETLYAHLSETLVNVGDEVSQGQVIAHMGSSGDSTGPHVHFEIRGAPNPF